MPTHCRVGNFHDHRRPQSETSSALNLARIGVSPAEKGLIRPLNWLRFVVLLYLKMAGPDVLANLMCGPVDPKGTLYQAVPA